MMFGHLNMSGKEGWPDGHSPQALRHQTRARGNQTPRNESIKKQVEGCKGTTTRFVILLRALVTILCSPAMVECQQWLWLTSRWGHCWTGKLMQSQTGRSGFDYCFHLLLVVWPRVSHDPPFAPLSSFVKWGLDQVNSELSSGSDSKSP